jgi:hypothetical protein
MSEIGEFQNIKHHGKANRQQAQLCRPYHRIYENLCNLHKLILQVANHHQSALVAGKTTNKISQALKGSSHKRAHAIYHRSRILSATF